MGVVCKAVDSDDGSRGGETAFAERVTVIA